MSLLEINGSGEGGIPAARCTVEFEDGSTQEFNNFMSIDNLQFMAERERTQKAEGAAREAAALELEAQAAAQRAIGQGLTDPRAVEELGTLVGLFEGVEPRDMSVYQLVRNLLGRQVSIEMMEDALRSQHGSYVLGTEAWQFAKDRAPLRPHAPSLLERGVRLHNALQLEGAARRHRSNPRGN